MRSLPTLAALGGAALMTFAQPAAAATALDGAIFQEVRSSIGAGPDARVVAMNSWTAGAPEDLVAYASATAASGADKVVGRSKLTATWDSADSGHIDVVDHGWTFTGADGDETTASTRLYPEGDNVDWTYAFTATADSEFQLDFDLLGEGAVTGLGSWFITFSQGGSDTTTSLASGFTPGSPLTGAWSHALTAGQTYRVSLRSDEGFSYALPLETPVTGKETGRFDWRIVEGSGAVPEPGAWALMIAGFGMAGATLRRRNRLIATA